MSFPTDPPDQWATNTNYSAGPYAGQPNKNAPPAGNVGEGFNPGAGLITSWMNRLWNNHGQWISALRNIVLGTMSAKSLVVDATGGSSVSGVAGNVTATGSVAAGTFISAVTDVSAGGNLISTGSANIGTTASAQKFVPSLSTGGTSAPTPATTKQALVRELVPLAVCRITAAGALDWGVNIASVSKTGTGTYTVNLTNGGSAVSKMIVTSNIPTSGYTVNALVNSTTQLLVSTFSGTALDAPFHLVVYGD